MKIQNPILSVDLPDPDVIRIGDTYYMVATTMFVMPGGPILKSKDLYHWELVSYIFDIIEDNDGYRLENGKNAYGRGQWATSLKYHNGLYYACFACNDTKKTYIYYTDNIEKSSWDRYVLDGRYYDMSFLFDDGRAYLIYGNGEIGIVQLKNDLSGIEDGGANRLLLSTPTENIMLRCEGCRAYKINGYYYLIFIEWPHGGRRRVVCYRSKELLGEYERRILLDDDMGYRNCGVAQGALIDTPDGEWYAMLFQDRGAVGRIPVLLPVSWEDGWPMMGIDGRVPETLELPFKKYDAEPLIVSDSFNHAEDKLDLRWEWNHNPEKGCWSFTKRPGYLRLHSSSLAKELLTARNTLTQRTGGPKCAFTVELDTHGMKPGDYAGLVALQGNYGMVGIKVDADGVKRIIVSKRVDGGSQQEEEAIPLLDNSVRLKIEFDFDGADTAEFYFSQQGGEWIKIGGKLFMKFTLDFFIGYRIGLFYYSEQECGGAADFSNFEYIKG